MIYKIDSQKLADNLEFDKRDVILILEAFIEDSKVNLINMHQAITSKDTKSIKSLAHAIKGSASNLLLQDIITITLQIEKSAINTEENIYKHEYLKLKNLLDGFYYE